MKKISSLTSPTDFKRVYQSGSTITNRFVVMRFVRRGDEPEKRVAFVAGKRLGGAVVRNRAKRLMREAMRRNIDKILPGYDIVFIARSSLKDRTYWEAEKGCLSALMAGGLIRKESSKTR